mgnify:FL=1
MPKVIGVRFKEAGKIFTFMPTIENLKKGTKVVVETSRGKEIGFIATDVYEEVEEKLVLPLVGISRVATEKDLKRMDELMQKRPNVMEETEKLVKKYNLDMKVVDASFTLDGQKVIIDFVCEDRVDFRDLVKDLASVLKLRIELRQIGIRDQAKVVGGIGECGRECCCKKYLNDFDKVSIKMAKTQGLSLNTSKISGICGRLMCCLAYENEYYSEINAKMPKLNSKVSTKDGEGIVVYNNLLKQIVSVKFVNDDSVKIVEYPLSEVRFTKNENNNPKK